VDSMTAGVNWRTSIFLVATFIVAIVATPLYFWAVGLRTFDVVHFAVMAIFTGMSITMGYHRLFAHRAYNAKWPVRLFTLLFGAASFENSVLDWASDHRYHHKYTDQDGDPHDPYSITRGFFWAHMGWLLRHHNPPLVKDNVPDLRRDPLVMWQYRYINSLSIAVGFLLPAAVGTIFSWAVGESLWIGFLGGLLIAGCARIVFVQHCTFFINSLCHYFGSRPYDGSSTARDNGLLAVFTFGEGYHNYHHAFQNDYRNGVRFWQFDPGKWAIWTLSKVGLASDLRRIPAETIRLARIYEKRRRLEARLEKKRQPLSGHVHSLLADLEGRLEQVHLQCRTLLSKRSRLATRARERGSEELARVRRELAEVRREFRRLARAWHLSHRLALVEVA